MKSITSKKKIHLSGKVVQTFENSGEKIAKIFIEPVSIDLFIDSNEEIYLEDVITLEVIINDKSITSNNSLNPLPF